MQDGVWLAAAEEDPLTLDSCPLLGGTHRVVGLWRTGHLCGFRPPHLPPSALISPVQPQWASPPTYLPFSLLTSWSLNMLLLGQESATFFVFCFFSPCNGLRNKPLQPQTLAICKQMPLAMS